MTYQLENAIAHLEIAIQMNEDKARDPYYFGQAFNNIVLLMPPVPKEKWYAKNLGFEKVMVPILPIQVPRDCLTCIKPDVIDKAKYVLGLGKEHLKLIETETETKKKKQQ